MLCGFQTAVHPVRNKIGFKEKIHRRAPRFVLVCQKKRCRRCGEEFLPERNHDGACRFHGGVLGDRAYFNWTADWLFGDGCPADRLVLIQRWTCCGATAKEAKGCKKGFHVSHDVEVEEDCKDLFLHGW
jgi:hypothetical protein